ncbi:hypothetical protein N836_35215 [Leptolyngbya sp. Heron Island J]|nr:hypothetical protein N836_35215 [Leptolyngbya sp. Heron Island J]
MATGAVTDLGANEHWVCTLAPQNREIAMVLKLLLLKPVISVMITGLSSFLSLESCRWSGTARATVAGLSKKGGSGAAPD